MRDIPERFIESNTENSWLRYLNNMSIQGTWADATYHSSSDRCIKSYYTNSKQLFTEVEVNSGGYLPSHKAAR